MANHGQITQNTKSAFSVHYVKKEGNDQVNFLHVNENESFLPIDCVIFDGDGLKQSQSSENSKFAMSSQYLKKEIRCEVDFNSLGIKVSCKVILSLLMGMIQHSQYSK